MRDTPTLVHILLLLPICLAITIVLAVVREPSPENAVRRSLKTFGILAGAMIAGGALLLWLGKLL